MAFVNIYDIQLDRDSRTLYSGINKQKLTPTELKLLEVFLDNPERNLSREFLVKKVWNTNYIEDTSLLQSHVTKLRKKIANCRKDWIIQTIWGWGYRMTLLKSK